MMWKYNYSSDTLCHYGVMGMKWGRRKAQNLKNLADAMDKQASKLKGYMDHDPAAKVLAYDYNKYVDAARTARSKAKEYEKSAKSAQTKYVNKQVALNNKNASLLEEFAKRGRGAYAKEGKRYAEHLRSAAKKLSEIDAKGIQMTKKEIRNWAIFGNPIGG